MNRNKLRVVIADDHPLIRLGLRKMFEEAPDITIAGEAANGQEAVALVEELDPDVLILDLQMPVMDGIQAMEYLHKCGAKVRILVVSAYHDSQFTSEILKLGAWGYFLKEEAPTMIVEAARQAARGDGQGTRPRPSARLVKRLAGAG